MSRERWPALLLIIGALTFFAVLQRPAVTSAQHAFQAGTPESTVTILPLETPTIEPTPGDVTPSATPPEPTFTPTPTATLIPTPVLAWDAAPERVNIAAGGQITVPLRLRVEQADVAQLSLSPIVSNTNGFTAEITPNKVQQLSAGDSINFVLTVHASPEQSVDDKAVVVVTADDEQGHLAQVEIPLSVAWPSVITAQFDPQDQPVDPGGSAMTRVTVTNRDTAPHTIQPRAYMDQGAPFRYKLPKLPESLTLQPGEEVRFKFEMRPLLGTPAGARGKVVFEAYLIKKQVVKDKPVTSDQAFARLIEKYRVDVVADPAEQQPAWSEKASYTLIITNTGSLEGDVDWEVSNGPDHYLAKAERPETLPHLKPGEATQVKLEVEPVFAGWFDYFNTISKRFHAMTDDDKQQFSTFVRDYDVTTTTVKLGNAEQFAEQATGQYATAEVEVITRRPERPEIELPAPVKAELVQAPAGHGPHAPNGLTCGACHSTHGSPMPDTPDQNSQLLLASTTRALCDTCHDGTGSIYNVEAGLINGALSSNAGPLKHPAEQKSITTGFLFELRNYLANKAIVSVVPPDPEHLDITVSGASAISAHPLERLVAPQGKDGLKETLLCTSCHDPHGVTGNARLVAIKFAGLEIPVAFKATYSQSPEERPNYVSGSVEACRACHTTVDNHGRAGPHKLDNNPDLGKPWDTYRARGAGWLPLESEGQTPNRHMVCLSCHTAHGSRASLPGRFEKLMREPLAGIEDKYGSWCAACHDL